MSWLQKLLVLPLKSLTEESQSGAECIQQLLFAGRQNRLCHNLHKMEAIPRISVVVLNQHCLTLTQGYNIYLDYPKAGLPFWLFYHVRGMALRMLKSPSGFHTLYFFSKQNEGNNQKGHSALLRVIHALVQERSLCLCTDCFVISSKQGLRKFSIPQYSDKNKLHSPTPTGQYI